MDKKREGEISTAAIKSYVRKEFAFRDIDNDNIKRMVANLVKEPEMITIRATVDELYVFAKNIVEIVFIDQMKKIS